MLKELGHLSWEDPLSGLTVWPRAVSGAAPSPVGAPPDPGVCLPRAVGATAEAPAASASLSDSEESRGRAGVADLLTEVSRQRLA